MEVTANSEIDASLEHHCTSQAEQECQSQTSSTSHIDNAMSNSPSSQGENDNDTTTTVAPDVSSGRRRRKQQMPQRCHRTLKTISQFELAAPATPVARAQCDTTEEHLSSYNQQLDEGASAAIDSLQIKLQPTSLNCYRQRKPIGGFHLKTLHRPYYKKGAKAVPRAQPHQCADCDLKFPLRESLLRHINVKHTVKIHQCSCCGKQYRLADSLRKHIKREHSGETHHCIVCDKYFTSKDSLKQHWRIHSGEKPFRCQVCSARFRYRNNYKQHVQMHSGVMESCKICGKQYSRRDSLMQHMREIHRQFEHGVVENSQWLATGDELSIPGDSHETPAVGNVLDSKQNHESNGLNRFVHYCRKCSQSFTTRQNLLRHMQIRHHKVILVCPICNLQYHLRDSLRKHVKNVHRMKLKDERNTRAEMEMRRRVKDPNSRILVADIEPDDSLNGQIIPGDLGEEQQEAAYTSTQQVMKKCPFCDRYYRHKDSLTRHVKSVHHMRLRDEQNRPTKAQLEISRLFKSPNSLEDGQEIGDSQNDIGPQGTSSSAGQISQASSYPNTAKLKKCPFCDRSYRLRDSLRRHIKAVHRKSIKDLKTETRAKLSHPTTENGLGHSDGSSIFQKDGHSKRENAINSVIDKSMFDEDDHSSSPILWNSLSPQVAEHATQDNSQEMVGIDIHKFSPLNDPESESKPDLSSHDHSSDKFACVTCGVSFENQEKLNVHSAFHPTCPLCRRQYTLRDSLRHHIKRTHPVYHQEMINRKKQKVAQLAREDHGAISNTQQPRYHEIYAETTETGSGSYTCSTCNMSFLSQEELDDHAAMHLQCPYCPKQYNLKDSLRKHIQFSHPAEYWERRSAKDNKSITGKLSRLKELSSSNQEDDVMGEVVDRRTNSSSVSMATSSPHSSEYQEQVEDHSESAQISLKTEKVDVGYDGVVENPVNDSEELNHSTVSCNHEFENEELRAQHLRKCAACPYCSKQYCLRDSLRKHIRRTHGDEYKADGLPTRVLLKHAAIGNQPNCSICDQAFESAAHLEEHQKVHPQCQYCGQVYALKESLRKHIYRKHLDIHGGGNGVNNDTDPRFVWSEAYSESLDGSESYSRSSQISGELDRSYEAGHNKMDFTNDSMNSGQSENGENFHQHAVDFAINGDAQFSNMFPCSGCMVVFETQGELDIHVKNHLACDVCGKLYTLRDSLRKHLKRSHPEVYNAMIEEKQQKAEQHEADMAKLLEYEQNNEEKNVKSEPMNDSDMAMQNLCYVCFIQFDSQELYESHTKMHPACPHCGKMYRLKDSLKKHVQRSHPAEYEAERESKLRAKMDAELEVNFSTTEHQALNLPQTDFSQLPDGLAIATKSLELEEQFFPCPACTRVFKTKELLDEHAQTHPECPHCGRRYKLIDSLRKHIKRTHPLEEEERRKNLEQVSVEEQAQYFERQLRGESDDLETSTMNEENTAEEEELHVFPCPACPVIFETRELLDEHVQIHPACPHCGKRYKLLDSLRRHMKRTHPAEEEERRQSLPKDGGQSSAYYAPTPSKSIETESGGSTSENGETSVDVLFPCPACSMIFHTKEALQDHASNHLSCPYCGRLYTLRNSMRKHIQRSHPMEYEAEKANNCSFGFANEFHDSSLADNPPAGADEGMEGSEETAVDYCDTADQESELADPVVPKINKKLPLMTMVALPMSL